MCTKIECEYYAEKIFKIGSLVFELAHSQPVGSSLLIYKAFRLHLTGSVVERKDLAQKLDKMLNIMFPTMRYR